MKNILGIGLFGLLLGACSPPPAELSTVDQLDAKRFAGRWYEIARLPMPFQAQCARNVRAEYVLNADGSLSVRNLCQRADGRWSQAVGLAWAEDGQSGRFRVSFLPPGLRWLPFGQAPYWVMAVDESHQYALIGQPSRRYLWLLSRSPQLDEALQQNLLAQAQAQGYDLSGLIRTPHTAEQPE